MKRQTIEPVLVSGSPAEVDTFMSTCKSTFSVDWRGDDDSVRPFEKLLPKGYLVVSSSPEELRVQTPSGAAIVTDLNAGSGGALALAAAAAALLPPEFEAHVFRATIDTDTHTYLVRPKAFWDDLRARHPARFEKLFAPPSALPVLTNFTRVARIEGLESGQRQGDRWAAERAALARRWERVRKKDAAIRRKKRAAAMAKREATLKTATKKTAKKTVKKTAKKTVKKTAKKTVTTKPKR